MKFKQNDAVEIRSLGLSYGDKTFPGKICGVAVDWGESSATIWIVECLALAKQIGFTHVTMPQGCLRAV
jgi:hypothetical protein